MALTAAEEKARRTLLMAAGASALGLAIAGTASQVVGGLVVLAGWLGFAFGLHAFGRAGSSSELASKDGEADVGPHPR